MSYSLEDKLVVGITTRALFDLEEANQVFETAGLAAYREYQQARETTPLAPGTAFAVVKGLLAINRRAGRNLVEVVVISRNDAESAVRVFNSIEHYRLPIERGVFRGGREPWPYLEAFRCSLFLSVEAGDVIQALDAGVPAALVLAPPEPVQADEEDQEVRIALDGDAVLFGDESEFVYQTFGLDEFHRHETEQVAVPLAPGPLEPFLRSLHRVQEAFPQGESPIRTALVTSRNAQAVMRAINTLRSWGVRIDETFFLGGIDKAEFLRIFRPHIFFDDQMSHLEGARRIAPSAQVPRRATQLEAFGDLANGTAKVAPLASVPQAASPRPARRKAGPGKGRSGLQRSQDEATPKASAEGARRAVLKR